ncbi:class I SAM-dependent methyltransferase [Pseudohaliea sp.]|uniref:class I SAM-dependent methyltransferase n=1 Tax=Pseudohaliea sp. TaxID=2740289 RepID=UPI0032ED5607
MCGAAASSFLPFGSPQRPDALCWKCHSLERHRFLWYFLAHRPQQEDGRFLHLAPERCLGNRLRRRYSGRYVSADLLRADVDIKLDITASHLPDSGFDTICCSHVLKHVEDDRAALKEIYRMLKPGGVAMIMVPVTEATTLEDPNVSSPEERTRRYGQADHVRAYGEHFVDRLREVPGARVSVVSPDDLLDRQSMQQMGINELAGDIFLLMKPRVRQRQARDAPSRLPARRYRWR